MGNRVYIHIYVMYLSACLSLSLSFSCICLPFLSVYRGDIHAIFILICCSHDLIQKQKIIVVNTHSFSISCKKSSSTLIIVSV